MIKKRNLDKSLVDYIDGLGMGMEARGALGGTVYYVEGNSGSDEEDGLSWDTAFKTLTKAFAVCHSNMAQRSRWARRNTIYIAGAYFEETLTLFPQKTDVVGVGSYDANTMAGIKGHHAPTTTAYGTRFFNVKFLTTNANSAIVTLTSATSGVQFIGCEFDGTGGTVNSAILATAHPFLKVIGCRMKGAFDTSYISFGTGEAGGALIQGNIMTGCTAAGIVLGSGTTAPWEMIIDDNLIEAATVVVDDNSNSGTGIAYVTRNMLISLASSTAGYAENMNINLGLAAGNYLTTPNIATVYPVLDTTT